MTILAETVATNGWDVLEYALTVAMILGLAWIFVKN